MVMATQEFERTPEESIDPLSEDADSPVPGLVHQSDRVLFLVTGTCPIMRAARSRMVGSPDGTTRFSTGQWGARLTTSPGRRSFATSPLGRRSLVLSDDRLEWLLSRLRRIPHVEFLRIGSKVPSSCRSV
jgi:lysine 2,3-aminomutase